MSSLPSKQKVDKLRETIGLYRRKVVELHAAKTAAAKVPDLEECATGLRDNIITLLESMDCKANGNMGWEARIAWMLTELVIPPHPDGTG